MTAPAQSVSPWKHFCEPGNAWTRNPAPAAWSGEAGATVLPLLELSLRDVRMWTAVHEAGHAVTAAVHYAYVTAGQPSIRLNHVYVNHAQWQGRALSRGGQAHITFVSGIDFYDLAIWAAAGERASDWWLREEGLWTPDRGWVNEVCALGDRDNISAFDSRWRVAYTDAERQQCQTDGVTPVDLAATHADTDEFLEEMWPAVRHVARLLYTHGRLTGAQARAVASQYLTGSR
ncbi:hypothetical protein ACWD4T_03985 [Streptomyces umbrinus]